MIDKTTEVMERGRVNDWTAKELRGLPVGHFFLKSPRNALTAYGVTLEIIASDGRIEPNGDPDGCDDLRLIGALGNITDWEHVSVSVGPRGSKESRTPTWEEMCWVKDQFWKPEEMVIQFHPAKSEYVNNHPTVLHLWRYKGNCFFPKPNSLAVGLAGATPEQMAKMREQFNRGELLDALTSQGEKS